MRFGRYIRYITGVIVVGTCGLAVVQAARHVVSGQLSFVSGAVFAACAGFIGVVLWDMILKD